MDLDEHCCPGAAKRMQRQRASVSGLCTLLCCQATNNSAAALSSATQCTKSARHDMHGMAWHGHPRPVRMTEQTRYPLLYPAHPSHCLRRGTSWQLSSGVYHIRRGEDRISLNPQSQRASPPLPSPKQGTAVSSSRKRWEQAASPQECGHVVCPDCILIGRLRVRAVSCSA